ncbi:MAG: hypothetical protein IK094_04070 [Treponema sp.]|nr:hypothetical protein [Treponema sp.]
MSRDQNCGLNAKALQDQKAAARLARYQKILCPEFPPFLKKYLDLKILARLKGIGLLCGTDWTPLFHNRFYYSRYDHSLNCALIVWNWTGDKKMTLAALLHDVSTPAFSHVIDFKNGDALTQESTEDKNAAMIRSDAQLAAALALDGLTAADVDDYHKYSICDNEVPQLSADRLEYMFPSGAALEGWFSLRAIKRFYGDLVLAKDENGNLEFAFKTKKIALDYFKRILKIGYFLQRNKDKIAMELMARVVDKAIACGALREEELWLLSERDIIGRWDGMLSAVDGPQSDEAREFLRLYKTYRTMKKVCGSSAPLDGYFCVQLAVKRRWINPLVAADSLGLANDSGAKVQTKASLGANEAAASLACEQSSGKPQTIEKMQSVEAARRICDVSARAKKAAEKFLAYNDTPYACVKLAQ